MTTRMTDCARYGHQWVEVYSYDPSVDEDVPHTVCSECNAYQIPDDYVYEEQF